MMTRLVFRPSADNERGPKYLEGLIAGWASMVGRESLSLGLMSEQGRLVFLLEVPAQQQRMIASQLANAFPGSSVEVLRETVESTEVRNRFTQQRCLRLSPDVLPLKLHQQFVEEHSREAVDPIEGLLEAVKAGRSGRVTTELWLDLQQARPSMVDRASRYARFVQSSGRRRRVQRAYRRVCSGRRWSQRLVAWLLSKLLRRGQPEPAIVDKLSQHLLEVRVRLSVTSDTSNSVGGQQLDNMQSALSQFTSGDVSFFVEKPRLGGFLPPSSFLLMSSEAASLWHPPIRSIHVPRVNRSAFRELEPPSDFASRKGSPGGVTLGRVCFRNERQRFELGLDARRRHLYVLGKTGMGKTTLLQNILAEDIAAGRGVAVIEPHGDLAESVLDLVPKRRTNDVIVFDPADTDFPIAFNPLRVPAGADSTVVADGVLSAFQKTFGLDESHAPRLLHIFRNCLLSLVEIPGATLLSVQRLLIDEAYRKTVIAQTTNPVVRGFWLDEFGKWKHQDRTAFIASLQNKLGAFLTNEKLQRVLGQSDSKLDLREVMDNKGILVVNLSKGRIGENASDLLGTLLVTSLQIAAMTRANIPEEQRQDFSIVIDEFQNYATPAIATFLSEARKYRTHMILSHQYTAQLPDEILAAVIGNVGSMAVFQIGTDDAELFERQLGGDVTAANLMNIPKYHAYCRLLMGGMPSPPFSMTTIPPNQSRANRSGSVRRRSRQQYAKRREHVDAEIRRQVM